MIKDTIIIRTHNRIEMIDITHYIIEFIQNNGITDGRLSVFVPHTTAGVTINENCDPDVQTDLNSIINVIIPKNIKLYHAEGNSDAHIKSSLVGVSLDLFVENKKLLLGTWQGVYFWEFDGARNRIFHIIYS